MSRKRMNEYWPKKLTFFFFKLTTQVSVLKDGTDPAAAREVYTDLPDEILHLPHISQRRIP